MIGYWLTSSVRLSVCDAVRCGSQGRCTGFLAFWLDLCSSCVCVYAAACKPITSDYESLLMDVLLVLGLVL